MLRRPGWPHISDEPIASAFLVLELQVCTIYLAISVIFDFDVVHFQDMHSCMLVFYNIV